MDKNLFTIGFKQDNKKVVPKITDDWVISDSYRNNALKVSSSRLNMSFDVPVSKFLRNCLDKNITITSNKIQGSFIFDKNREICSEQEFFEWEDEQEQKEIIEIKKAELIIGNHYKLEDGSTGYYLGTKYMARLKNKTIDIDNVGKISKKHFFKVDSKNMRAAQTVILNKKVIDFADDKVISQEEIDRIFTKFYNDNPSICYLKDFKVENPKYDFVECSDKVNPVAVEIGNGIFVPCYFNNSLNQGSNYVRGNQLYSSFVPIQDQNLNWYRNEKWNCPFDKRLRINAI